MTASKTLTTTEAEKSKKTKGAKNSPSESTDLKTKATASGVAQRVDSAHRMSPAVSRVATTTTLTTSTSSSATSPPLPSPAPSSLTTDQKSVTEEEYTPPRIAEQVHEQVRQLAVRLRVQQKDLARREEQFCAQLAKFENETRTARLLTRERELELAEREQRIDKQASSATAEMVNDGANKREEQALLKQKQAIEAKSAQFDEAEQLLKEHVEQIERDRLQLNQQQEKFSQEMRQQRKQWAEQQRVAETKIQQEQKTLTERAAAIEKRRAALEAIQTDVTRTHRESLEMRLATEELWSQLLGKMTPAKLTQSLARIRARLTDQYRLAETTLAEQKSEIKELVQRLVDKKKDFETQRQQIERWANQQHTEIEQQAARLVAREQELDRQQSHFEQSQEQWAKQRRELQQTIQQLTSQLRHAPV